MDGPPTWASDDTAEASNLCESTHRILTRQTQANHDTDTEGFETTQDERCGNPFPFIHKYDYPDSPNSQVSANYLSRPLPGWSVTKYLLTSSDVRQYQQNTCLHRLHIIWAQPSFLSIGTWHNGQRFMFESSAALNGILKWNKKLCFNCLSGNSSAMYGCIGIKLGRIPLMVNFSRWESDLKPNWQCISSAVANQTCHGKF